MYPESFAGFPWSGKKLWQFCQLTGFPLGQNLVGGQFFFQNILKFLMGDTSPDRPDSGGGMPKTCLKWQIFWTTSWNFRKFWKYWKMKNVGKLDEKSRFPGISEDWYILWGDLPHKFQIPGGGGGEIWPKIFRMKDLIILEKIVLHKKWKKGSNNRTMKSSFIFFLSSILFVVA